MKRLLVAPLLTEARCNHDACEKVGLASRITLYKIANPKI